MFSVLFAKNSEWGGFGNLLPWFDSLYLFRKDFAHTLHDKIEESGGVFQSDRIIHFGPVVLEVILEQIILPLPVFWG